MNNAPNLEYGLGHSAHELERLKAQARLIEPATRQYFREAGLSAGMKVLDIGSGAGDVAFLAAEMVGGGGSVTGVDRSKAALECARSRLGTRSNVSFREGDPMTISFDAPFDAVVGRYVVQFQRDPAAMLRRLATLLKPGGLMIFHETDWFTAFSDPPAPLHDACCRWIVRTMELQGAQMHMGLGLHRAFKAAGLPEPEMRLRAVTGGGDNAAERLRMLVTLVETLTEPMLRFGVATPSEIDPKTLMERLRADIALRESVIVAHADVGAWVQI
jgi:SAM-dependent methyltransferase